MCSFPTFTPPPNVLIISDNFKILTFFFFYLQDKDGAMIYPADEPHEQTFAYLFVDPFKKNIIVLYHHFWWGQN